MPTAPTTLDPGTTVLERYRIVRKLGTGGMGSVYLCDDLHIGVAVALKFMDAALTSDPRFVGQLLNETRLARRVTHPNVCRVHDVGEVGGVAFLSMEYVDGEDLKSLLRRIGRLPHDKAIQFARQLCLGLFAAHEQGVLHRDLKPQNIMVDGDGNVRITDFGIAIERERVEGKDGETVSGTPAYLAPEVLGGGPPSVRSDLYALGLVLHEVFTGRRVYEGTSMTELVEARSRHPRPPSDFVRDLDRDVERAILACLAPDPAHRPESAMAVLAAFPGRDPLADALASGETPSPALIAAAGSARKATPRSLVAMIAVAVVGYVAAMLIHRDLRQIDGFDAPLPPEVLADRARALARDLGEPAEKGAEAFGFEARDGAASRDGGLTFTYRRAVRNEFQPADLKARVTYADPPLETTGGYRLRFDPYGHLRAWTSRFDGVDPSPNEGASPEARIDRVWRSSGLDRAAFRSVAASGAMPPVYADAHQSFSGSVADEEWRVDVATLLDRVVWFRAGSAAEVDVSDASGRGTGSEVDGVARSGTWRGALQLGLIAIALAMSIHTLRNRRGDLGGALRVGAAAFCAVVLFTLLLGDTGGAWEGLAQLAVRGMTHGIAVGALLGLQYFAIEAHVRRIWPHTVIGWSRLLSGRVADPLLGREMVAGLAAGVVAACAFFAFGSFVRAAAPDTFIPMSVHRGAEEWLSGVGHGIGVLLELCVDMAREAFKLFFTLILLRLVTRSPIAAVLLTVVIWSWAWFPIGCDLGLLEQVLSRVLFSIVVAFYVGVVVRFGLVSIVVSCITLGIMVSFPLRPDLDHWNAGVTALAPIVLAGSLAFFARAAFMPASFPLRTSTSRA